MILEIVTDVNVEVETGGKSGVAELGGDGTEEGPVGVAEGADNAANVTTQKDVILLG